MAKHYFKTECPRCGKRDEICCEGHAAPPELKCGECLMNDVEVVALKVTPLRRELARTKKSENFTVRETGQIDGGAYRVVEFPDGSARVEGWGAKGWTPGGASFGEIFDAPPVSARFAVELGIPISDLGSIYVRGIKPPLSDYERDDRESDLQIDTFQRLIEERKRQQLQNEKDDRER